MIKYIVSTIVRVQYHAYGLHKKPVTTSLGLVFLPRLERPDRNHLDLAVAETGNRGLVATRVSSVQLQSFTGYATGLSNTKGNASEWFTRNIEHPDQPIRDWSLESVIEGLQKRFLNSLTHRQASNKFNTIEQGHKIVQQLIQELTKYAAQMVQYPDDYSFRRQLLATLKPSLQKEVLCRGITVEFSSMQDILEKAKDIEDSL